VSLCDLGGYCLYIN